MTLILLAILGCFTFAFADFIVDTCLARAPMWAVLGIAFCILASSITAMQAFILFER